MGEKLKLSEFDILGVISLDEVQGIEKYVTPVIENGVIKTYLSRSKEYYNIKSMSELAVEREELAQKLTNEVSKRNFVIVENMLNCSGKVYFKKFERYISEGKNEQSAIQLAQAKECMMEDVKNLIAILEQRHDIQINPNNRLPGGIENSERRAIEMDNKALLYIFAQSLKMKKSPEEIEVLTPGYGSIYVGPFLKAMYGYEFTNTLKSKYIEETKNSQEKPIRTLMSTQRPFREGVTVLVLDDNIGTGATMRELKQSLEKEGVYKTITGAVQYNWRNYYRISVGEKVGIKKPDVCQYDIVTPINYAGHKLYKHAIDTLLSSGSDYIKYLQTKSYRKDKYSDIEGAIIRAANSASRMEMKLPEEFERYVMLEEDTVQEKEILPEYKEEGKSIQNPIANEIISRIIQKVESIKERETIQNSENSDYESR